MKAIGVDPSLTSTGLAALDFEARQVIAWKVVTTKPDAKYKATEDLARRLLQLAAEVRTFTDTHRGVVVVEGQVGSSFGKDSSMASVGLLLASYGAVLGALKTKPIVIHSASVKSRLGSKSASKDETWQIAKRHFTKFPPELSTKAGREAVHDAVAIAVAGLPEMEQLKALQG